MVEAFEEAFIIDNNEYIFNNKDSLLSIKNHLNKTSNGYLNKDTILDKSMIYIVLLIETQKNRICIWFSSSRTRKLDYTWIYQRGLNMVSQVEERIHLVLMIIKIFY